MMKTWEEKAASVPTAAEVLERFKNQGAREFLSQQLRRYTIIEQALQFAEITQFMKQYRIISIPSLWILREVMFLNNQI